MLTCGRVECWLDIRPPAKAALPSAQFPCLQGTGLLCSMVDVHACWREEQATRFQQLSFLSFALQERTNGRPAATSLELVALLLGS